jgi:hypothetical protein
MPYMRIGRTLIAAAISAAAITPGGLVAAAAPVAGSSLGYTTISDDNLRTGWDGNEAALSPSDVSGSDFGQLFRAQVDGQVYAAPLVVDRTASSPGVLIVATENNNVYGLNPASGRKKWEATLGTPWSASVLSCGDLVPNVGVTSTPVFDPATDSVYVMAKDAPDGANSTTPRWQLHSLDPATGFERPGWPTVIGGHRDNDPLRTFNPKTAAQRPGLLLLDGAIYAGFASHCDKKPYVGYVVGVDAATGKQTAMFSTEVGTDRGEAGIWQSGGGLISDGDRQIIVTTGNGDTAPVAPGNQPPGALSESVVRLTVQSDRTLRPTDWFAPSNGDALNQIDADLGSGGPLAIPDGYGTTAHPHLLVQVGKDGRVFLLDRDDLGGNSQGPDGTDDVLGVTLLGAGVWGHPGFWGGTPDSDSAGGYIYVVENAGYLRALKLSSDGSGLPVLVSTANSAMRFGYTSGSPVVTSNGTAANTALVWVVGVDGVTGTSPVLRAFNAQPSNGTLSQVFSAPLNAPDEENSDSHGAKFTTVATDSGRVFVGTRDGYVFGFGRPSSAPIYSAPIDLGAVPVGVTSAPTTATLTASRAVRVTDISASPPYKLLDSPSFPQDLAAGDPLPVTLTVTPTTAGDQGGVLTVHATESGTASTINFGIDAYGTRPGLAAYPPSVDFGTVPLPGHNSQGVALANTSGAPETVTAVTAPDIPFASSDLPSVGQVIPAGASLAVPLDYGPTAASGEDLATMSVTVDPGAHELTVPLSGSAVVGASNVVLVPTSLNFGLVPKGRSSTQSFEIANHGDILLTINKAKAPFGEFATTAPVSEGQTITPDQSVIQTVTFTPTRKGTATATYEITGSDGSGPHYERLVGIDDQLTDRYNTHLVLRQLLRAPTGPTHSVKAGYVRRFVNGRMFWLPAAGIHSSYGRILKAYLHRHGARGSLGYPTSGVVRFRHGVQQAFQHGRITWTRPKGINVSHHHARD